MTVDALTDVAGLRVGHATRTGGGWLTGTTVVLAPPGGAVAAVDVRGGGPGTKETDALDPRNLVQKVEAVVLTGGSAYGLDSASGVMAWLEERGRGVRVGVDPAHVVPVVPAACVFDLGRGGDFRARPDAATGRAAVEAADASGPGAPVAEGCVGAGTGATVGRSRAGSVRRAPCSARGSRWPRWWWPTRRDRRWIRRRERCTGSCWGAGGRSTPRPGSMRRLGSGSPRPPRGTRRRR